MKSLRARLLAGIICSFACLLIVFGLVLDIAIEYTLTREFDFYLESVARTLAAGIEIEGKHINVKLVPEALQDIPLVEGELFSQYWTSDGTVLAKSGNLSGHNLPRFRGDQGFGKTQPFILPDGRHARAAGMKISLAPGAQRQQTGGSSNDERHLILAVARDTTDLESHVRQLRWLLLAAGAVTIIIGSLVSIAVVHRSLRPLSRVAEAIETIKEDTLHARIPLATIPSEIVPVVDRLNRLLTRLEGAFDRERSLTSDIAHELRTPVAGILTTTSVALTSVRTASEYQEALRDVREIARQMRAIIENLLMIARFEVESANFQLEPINLSEMLDTCWGSYKGKASERSVRFDNRIPTGATCFSDRSALTIIITNLVENAVEYTDRDGCITATFCHRDSLQEIGLANTASQLTHQQVARVFDRFWRGDPSRTNTAVHAGLGLALVRRIITKLGGSIDAKLADGIFTLRISLPATRSQNSGSDLRIGGL